MSIIDELVFDRTQNDVDRVFTLKKKILKSGLNALSAEEKAEYMAGMKGAYNYTDMNRVGGAVAYIANEMIALPDELSAYRALKGVDANAKYEVSYVPSSIKVSAKTDWQMGDTPTQSQAASYLEDLAVLGQQLELPQDTPEVPKSMDKLTFSAANDMERLLFVIHQAFLQTKAELYDKIDRAAAAYSYTGVTYCE